MMGRAETVNINDSIIRPLLGFAGTVALFLVPMITMRLFAEEKRTGTIELLLTSPVKDIEIILGKWLGAVALYALRAVHVGGQYRAAVRLGQAGLEAGAGGYLGLMLQGGVPAGDRRVHLHHDAQPDHRRHRHLLRLSPALAAELVHGVRDHGRAAQVVNYIRSSRTSIVSQRACSIPRTSSFTCP